MFKKLKIKVLNNKVLFKSKQNNPWLYSVEKTQQKRGSLSGIIKGWAECKYKGRYHRQKMLKHPVGQVYIFPGVQVYIHAKQWHPTPVLLPGKSHGRRSLVGCSPWGLKETDTAE